MGLRGVRVGTWLLAVGAVHVATAPVFFADSLRSIGEAGVLFAVEADPEAVPLRASGFWYTNTGLVLLVAGGLTRHAERHLGAPPPMLPPALAAFGLWGILLNPLSGFWVFLPLAELTRRRLRAARRSGHPLAA